MGHGYFAVVANGIIIDLKLITKYLGIHKKNIMLLLEELKYYNDEICEHKLCNKYITDNNKNIDFEHYLKNYKFNFHYEEQYSPTNVFITFTDKEIMSDTRGSEGHASIINTEHLILENDEIYSIQRLANILTGETHPIKFLMYTYEGS
jgi:hypothetical protein